MENKKSYVEQFLEQARGRDGNYYWLFIENYFSQGDYDNNELFNHFCKELEDLINENRT